MAYFIYEQSRIRKLKLPKSYDLSKIQIGIPADENKKQRLGVKNIGDIVLPSGDLGTACMKNAYGYSYSDKTQPMEYRYVTTNWIQPYGNENASSVACDVYKRCYPKVEVAPTDIEIELFEDKNKNQYLIANLTNEIRTHYLVETVNIFLEIFGKCYIYSDEFNMNNSPNRRRCNWEILPPGEKPSNHMSNMHSQQGKEIDSFNISRLKTIERFKYEEVVEGINGFQGYYAYVFKNCCVLESAIYGNATYIIPKENWETLSQETKKELLDNNFVIEKVIHTANWQSNICRNFKKMNIS